MNNQQNSRLYLNCISIIFLCYFNCVFADDQGKNASAILWYNGSIEKNSIYKEIFELSKPVLLNAKKNKVKSGYVCGVVFDVDETLLDSSQFNYMLLKENKPYSENAWIKYVNANKYTIATPGASDITHYIHNLGCIVNIVTNRSTNVAAPTKNSLDKYNIYYDQILFAENNVLDKNPRFQAIINGKSPSKFNYKQYIIAYYGDNIQDFPNSYQETYRNQEINSKAYDKFGVEYFCLPNPMYGSWLSNKID